MKNKIVRYGLIGGTTVSILFLLTMTLGSDLVNFDNGQTIGYATMIIALTTVFLGIKSVRDNEQAGLISFGKAFKVGILITLIASACYIAMWMVYSNTEKGSQIMVEYSAHMMEKMEANGATVEEIAKFKEQNASFMEMYKNPLVKIGFTFLEIFPVGLIITLISALILKRGVRKE